MALTSTLPAVKTALLAALQADGALAGIQVSRSWPGDTLQQNAVWMGEATAHNTIPVVRGARVAREENITVDVYINCQCPGADASAAEAQAFEILGEVENILANDPTLGRTDGVIKAYVESWQLKEGLSQSRLGWASQIIAGVAVQARLV